MIEHIGDGVYAEWSGYDIQLRVNDHRNPVVVCLDPKVMEALIQFYKRATEQNSTQTETRP